MPTDTAQKERNKEIYKDTEKICKENPVLKKAIKDTLSGQRIILETDTLDIPESCRNGKPEIVVTDKRTFRAAMDHLEGKVCVLNFANAISPGGGVKTGSRAQEESLCRISTLMPCLSDKRCKEEFYKRHKQMNDLLGNDDLIFSPGVVVIKEDDADMQLMPEERWRKVDVITCAAPHLKKEVTISDRDLKRLLVKRIGRIFQAACNGGADILIVGAFGCGAFRNPPEVVCAAFEEVIKKYGGWFRVIEFAVPKFEDNPNNRIFSKWFGGSQNP